MNDQADTRRFRLFRNWSEWEGASLREGENGLVVVPESELARVRQQRDELAEALRPFARTVPDPDVERFGYLIGAGRASLERAHAALASLDTQEET